MTKKYSKIVFYIETLYRKILSIKQLFREKMGWNGNEKNIYVYPKVWKVEIYSFHNLQNLEMKT